jgi:hypothetical protein
MLIESPKIDTRSCEQLVADMESQYLDFLPDGEPGEGDPGLALIKIFSHMTKEVIDRLNQVPQKYFGAFLEMLGVSLLPASAARAPVTFYLSEGADTHVLIPKGTAVAAGEKDVVFETETNMWATPANLIKIFALDRKTDEIYSLPLEMAAGYELFKGENLQTHILYLGDDELFNTDENAGHELSGLIGPFEQLTWEYAVEQTWCPFDTVNKVKGNLILTMTPGHEIKEQEINGIASKWIRCIYKAGSYGVEQFQIPGADEGGIKLARPLAAGENQIFPDAVFCNETPVDLGTAEQPNPIYPFGNRPVRHNTIYIGSREAFSKKGGQVTLYFDMAGDIEQQDETLRLSWEYGTLDGWKAIQGMQTSDETGYYRFRKSGSVSFTCPADIQPLEVGGQENYWICIRIIDGDYGKEMDYNFEKQEWQPGVVEPPVIKKITIHYKIAAHYLSEPTTLQHCITYNNLEYKRPGNNPFYLLADQYQQRTLLLGFDKKIEKGPISIYFSFAELESKYRYAAMSLSKVLWQYYSGDEQWKALETVDNTKRMTRNGDADLPIE